MKSRRKLRWRLCTRTLLLAEVTLLSAPLAVADEGGVPFWLLGQFSSLAAVPPTPGARAQGGAHRRMLLLECNAWKSTRCSYVCPSSWRTSSPQY